MSDRKLRNCEKSRIWIIKILPKKIMIFNFWKLQKSYSLTWIMSAKSASRTTVGGGGESRTNPSSFLGGLFIFYSIHLAFRGATTGSGSAFLRVPRERWERKWLTRKTLARGVYTPAHKWKIKINGTTRNIDGLYWFFNAV